MSYNSVLAAYELDMIGRSNFVGSTPNLILGRILPYISYTVCAAPKGMVFEPFWSENGYRVWFLREPRERINVFVFSSPNE